MTNEFLHSTAFAHFVRAFTAMIIHSLWQGLLITLLAGALLYLCRAHSAQRRYRMLLLLLSGFVACCTLTFWWSFTVPEFKKEIWQPLQLNHARFSGFVTWISDFLDSNALLLFAVWFFCFLFQGTKVITASYYLKRLRIDSDRVGIARWVHQLTRMSEKMGIKTVVRLIESPKVTGPMVIGHLTPVILFPLGYLNGLPVAQLEAILWHELAHIRRYDYLVNLIQNWLEAFFFFNPGLLLLSKWIREQREYSADELAVAYCKNPKDYLLALISAKEKGLLDSLSIAFNGRNSGLSNRVLQVLGKPYQLFPTAERIFFAFAGFALTGLLLICISANNPARNTPVVKNTTVILIPKENKVFSIEKRLRTVFPGKANTGYTKVNRKSTANVTLQARAPIRINFDGNIESKNGIAGAQPQKEKRSEMDESFQTMDQQYKETDQYNKAMEKRNPYGVQYPVNYPQYNRPMENRQ